MATLHGGLKNKEFWYKDLLLACNNLPDFERDDVNLETNFSKNIKLKTPFISSPMDTVTESQMAIMMALLGGIGVIHYNMSPKLQAQEVEATKRFEAGFVTDPILLSPKHKVSDIFKIAEKYGFWSVPITQDGTKNTKLLGIVTHRDVRYLETPSEYRLPLSKVMTSQKRLITAKRSDTLDKKDIRKANKLIRKHNLDTLPIVDSKFRLAAIVTDSDIKKNDTYPLATKDGNKQLKVLAAIESRMPLAKKRVGECVDAGADGVVIDASIVFKEQLDIAKYLKKNYKNLEVIIGNAAYPKMIKTIQKEAGDYVDAIRVGIGPGAACITQDQLGIGRAQASAIWHCSKASNNIPIIADGGIRGPSDIVKAFALGADSAMMGGMLAGLKESPGDPEFDEDEGHLVKKYRGMGSIEAMKEGGDVRYRVDTAKIRIAEGKVQKVGYKGSGFVYIPTLIAAVKQSMQKLGFKNIKTTQSDAEILPNQL